MNKLINWNNIIIVLLTAVIGYIGKYASDLKAQISAEHEVSIQLRLDLNVYKQQSDQIHQEQKDKNKDFTNTLKMQEKENDDTREMTIHNTDWIDFSKNKK